MGRRVEWKTGLALGLALMAAGTGCSRIKSYFPDKEKDYQYSNEIPPLEIPPDLSSTTIEDSRIQPVANAGLGGFTPSVAGGRPPEKEAEQPAPEKNSVVKMRSASLEIAEPFAQAWRLVDQGLGRKALEVSDRDRSRGVFYVMYEEAEEDAPEQGGLWAEFLYIFGKVPVKESELRVLLEEKEPGVTEVTVLDKEGKQVTQGAALKLLQLIREGIESEP